MSGRPHYRPRRDPHDWAEAVYADPRVPTSGAMVRRTYDDGDDHVEEIHRDYIPGDRGYKRRETTIREGMRRRPSSAGDPYYDYDEYDERPYYGDRRSKRYSKHSRRSYSSSPSRSPPRRRKSLSEQALGALKKGGLALAGGVAADRYRHSNRRRSRSYSYSPSPDRRRGGGQSDQISQVVKAALAAGAAEAFRARKEPGGWTGDKGKRILTAAISAGGADTILGRDGKKHSKRHIVESMLAGLATNRLVNGPRSKSRSRAQSVDRSGRGRSKSRVRDLAGGGLLAAAAKELYDRARSKSRGRGRSDSRDSYDSRSPSPRPRGSHKRSKSVSAYLNKGMAALGFSDEADREDRQDRRRDGRSSRYNDYYRDESSDDEYRSGRYGHPRDPYVRDRDVGRLPGSGDGSSTALSRYQRKSRGGGGSSHSSSNSDSDLGSSTDEERTKKKLQRDQVVTGAFATVATVHAAHGLSNSLKARKRRRQLVDSGKMTAEEAHKIRMKNTMKDGFNVGMAALGIKGAVGEWKEAQEKRHERKEFQTQAHQRAEKRALRRSKSQSSAQRSRSSIDSYDSYRHAPPRYLDGNPYSMSGGLPPPPGPPPVTY